MFFALYPSLLHSPKVWPGFSPMASGRGQPSVRFTPMLKLAGVQAQQKSIAKGKIKRLFETQCFPYLWDYSHSSWQKTESIFSTALEASLVTRTVKCDGLNTLFLFFCETLLLELLYARV